MPLRFGLYRFGRGCAFAPGFDASPDPSRETLDLVLEGAKPRGWIAGHWHEREDWMLGRLECHVLDMVKGGPACGKSLRLLACQRPWRREDGARLSPAQRGFIALRESADVLYACADLEGLQDRKLKAGIATAPALGLSPVKTDGMHGVRPRDIDRMLENLGRTGWLPWKA